MASGNWIIWGDAREPIKEDLSKEEAIEEVNRINQDEDLNVYAEDNETGEVYEGEYYD